VSTMNEGGRQCFCFVCRIWDVGCRLVGGGLGLIGFVFSFRTGWVIFVRLCDNKGCVGFGVLAIGFVLHEKVVVVIYY